MHALKAGRHQTPMLPKGLQIVMVWCLLVSVPLMGLSSALTQLLGARHVHHETTAARTSIASATLQLIGWLRQVPALAELREMRERAHAESHRAGVAHSHGSRHHHGAQDPSVILLDAPAPDGGTAEALAPVLALTANALVWTPPEAGRDWSTAPDQPFRSASPPLEERPPRA